MTEGAAGMTEGAAGMTEGAAGMTGRALRRQKPPSVIPDVSNRESRVFSVWKFPSLTV